MYYKCLHDQQIFGPHLGVVGVRVSDRHQVPRQVIHIHTNIIKTKVTLSVGLFVSFSHLGTRLNLSL